jgi:hypothetical protein
MIRPRFRHAACKSTVTIMKAANLHHPGLASPNIMIFPAPSALSGRIPLPPVCGLKTRRSPGPAKKSTPHRASEDPVSESRLSELFALKRAEKPPENFLADFIVEFRRRNYGSSEGDS